MLGRVCVTAAAVSAVLAFGVSPASAATVHHWRFANLPGVVGYGTWTKTPGKATVLACVKNTGQVQKVGVLLFFEGGQYLDDEGLSWRLPHGKSACQTFKVSSPYNRGLAVTLTKVTKGKTIWGPTVQLY
jgi:hypothetical protein